MNPPGPTPPPIPPLFLLINRLLIGVLIVCFAFSFYRKMQDSHYAAMAEAGVTALAKKDTARAREHFDAFLAVQPENPSAYKDVASACAALKEPVLAVEYIQRGLVACKTASKPQRAQLYVALSGYQTLVEPAHPQTKAIASARTALALDPQNPSMQNAVGYTLVDNDQNLDEAEKLLRQSLQSLQESGKVEASDDERPLVEDSYGWLLYKKGDYAGSVAALNQAIADLPSGAAASSAKYYYYHLGSAYRKAGQIDDARRTLAIALQYDPAFPEAKAEEALLPPLNAPAAPSIGAPPLTTPVQKP